MHYIITEWIIYLNYLYIYYIITNTKKGRNLSKFLKNHIFFIFSLWQKSILSFSSYTIPAIPAKPSLSHDIGIRTVSHLTYLFMLLKAAENHKSGRQFFLRFFVLILLHVPLISQSAPLSTGLSTCHSPFSASRLALPISILSKASHLGKDMIWIEDSSPARWKSYAASKDKKWEQKSQKAL